MIDYRTVVIDGHKVFYREAGSRGRPVLLLLHGFSSSSHMFCDLISLLENDYHIVAPDLPGFGFTEVSSERPFLYTFDNLARIVELFTEALELAKYAIYVFDYGAPVGFRLAVSKPDRVTAIISQNGNAYEEGLSEAWAPIQKYSRDAAPVQVQGIRLMLQYLQKSPHDDVKLSLFLDYANTISLYPVFQEYFRNARPPFLAIWGEQDTFFRSSGAQAFARDIPDAEVHILNAGHRALQTHAKDVAAILNRFLMSTFQSIAA